jgi:hypothetical protein
MTISYVGSAAAEATSVTLPAHQAGDLIVLFAWNGGSLTIPTVPSGWLIIRNWARNPGANRAGVIAYKMAASASETSGTWTNAAMVGVAIYRDDANILALGGDALGTDINSTGFTYQALPVNTNTTAAFGKMRSASGWLIGIGGANVNDQSLETPPSGMTNRLNLAGASTNEISIHDTNSNVSSWASTNVTLASTTVGSSCVLEIFDTGIPKSSGGGFRAVNIRGGSDQ